MTRSAWWLCLLVCSVTWGQSAGSEPFGVAGDGRNGEGSRASHWMDAPVRLCCVSEPAKRVLQRLADQLQVRVWFSEQLTDALAETRVTALAGCLPAQAAFRWVARLCGAQAVIAETGVYLGPPADHAVAWTMWCRQRTSSSPSPDGQARLGKRAAVDLHDASVLAAVERLGESFGVNHVLLPGAAACQDLVTLQAVDTSLSDAYAALCRQTGMSVRWLDGLFVCGLPEELDLLARRVVRRVDPQAFRGRSKEPAGRDVGQVGAGERAGSGDLAAALQMLQEQRQGLGADLGNSLNGN